MNRMGALMNILLAIGIGFIIWKALDERLDVVEKLVARIRPLRKHPRISLAVMLAVIVPLGLIFMVLRVPEVIYYTLSGVIIITALTLFEGALKYLEEHPEEAAPEPVPEEPAAETETPSEETETEPESSPEETADEPVPEADAPAEAAEDQPEPADEEPEETDAPEEEQEEQPAENREEVSESEQ